MRHLWGLRQPTSPLTPVPALLVPLSGRRSPLTIRKDCSAARAHQVFINLGLRHLLVVDAHTRVVGIITRKDLDHAAGHGWWRMSHVAEPPKNKFVQQLRAIGSVGFLARLLGERRSGSGSGGLLWGPQLRAWAPINFEP